jgi:hypothetical protein
MKKAIFTIPIFCFLLAMLPGFSAHLQASVNTQQMISEDEIKPVAKMILDAKKSRNKFSAQAPFVIVRTNETF